MEVEGKRLISITGSSLINYVYNAQGLRTSKTVDGDTTSYLYEGTKVIQMTKNVGDSQYVIDFVYDTNGMLIGLNTTEGQYFYRRDITGNIIGILDSDGAYVVRYRYDAWGNVLSKTVNVDCIASNHNTFIYKGYMYDEETGWYYLQSRYYVPSLCRFLSPDSIEYVDTETIGGLNLYAYCNNDPINRFDLNGHFWDTVLDIGFIIWGISDLVNGGWKDWENWVSLGLDIAFAVAPFVPAGAGKIIKVGNKIDNATDVASAINKMDNIQDISNVTIIGRNADRVKDTAALINRSDDIFHVWKGFDSSSKGVKRAVHNLITLIQDGHWMRKKLKHGFTIIDIGLRTADRGFGMFYGIERFVIALWKTRNIWKLPLNYYF